MLSGSEEEEVEVEEEGYAVQEKHLLIYVCGGLGGGGMVGGR